jgi:hypothetical protein
MVSELGAVAALPGMQQQTETVALAVTAGVEAAEPPTTAAAAASAEAGAGLDSEAHNNPAETGLRDTDTNGSMAFPVGSGAAAAKLVQEARAAASTLVVGNQEDNGITTAGVAVPVPSMAHAGFCCSPAVENDDSSTGKPDQTTASLPELAAEKLIVSEGVIQGPQDCVLKLEDVVIAEDSGNGESDSAAVVQARNKAGLPLVNLWDLD